MKKLLKPEMEFIKFNTEDVITTSGGGQINLSDDTEVNPGPDSPANQQDWGEPSFNK